MNVFEKIGKSESGNSLSRYRWTDLFEREVKMEENRQKTKGNSIESQSKSLVCRKQVLFFTLLIVLFSLSFTPVAVSAADNAKIVTFSPPTGVVQRGDQVTATVRVKNIGTTNRSFWVGLSFASPNATSESWPSGWYDVDPMETSFLSSNQEQQGIQRIPK